MISKYLETQFYINVILWSTESHKKSSSKITCLRVDDKEILVMNLLVQSKKTERLFWEMELAFAGGKTRQQESQRALVAATAPLALLVT